MTTIDETKLEELQKLWLKQGSHDDFSEGACAMEAVAWLANEPHSDRPKCACPVIAVFVSTWNDGIRDDARRTGLLLPLVPLMVKSRGSDKLALRRAFLVLDWLVRAVSPAWLRLAGLEEHAVALGSLPEISTIDALCDAVAVTGAAKDDARELSCVTNWGDEDYNYSRYAVDDAAKDAAESASKSVIHRAARSDVYAASGYASAAVDYAARVASATVAKSQLGATVSELQASAQDLVRRMCALTEVDVEAWSWDESEAT